MYCTVVYEDSVMYCTVHYEDSVMYLTVLYEDIVMYCTVLCEDSVMYYTALQENSEIYCTVQYTMRTVQPIVVYLLHCPFPNIHQKVLHCNVPYSIQCNTLSGIQYSVYVKDDYKCIKL